MPISPRLPRLSVLVSVFIAIFILAQSVTGLPASAQAQPVPPSRPVLAYYYTWWDPWVFSRTLYQPFDHYNSDDPAVIERHVQQAQSAGINGFVMSWYGNGDRTDHNFRTLLDIGARSGFHSTIHFETPLFSPWGVGDVVAQLQAFYASYADHPAVLRYEGRPVIFFWRASTYDNATWDWIRAQVDPERRAVWIADGDQFGILAGGAWDGISPYAIAWSGNPAGQLPAWAAKARAVAPDKLWIPPVSPGCDDRAARPATCIQDRGDGSYYRATIDGALASEPSWAVIVNTFNEWMESTQIEPSPQYGDLYLQITRDLAEAHHATVPAADAGEGVGLGESAPPEPF